MLVKVGRGGGGGGFDEYGGKLASTITLLPVDLVGS